MTDTRGKIAMSDAEWRRRLTPEQFEVARRGGTERPFTGALWRMGPPGVYACICCGTPLFGSDDKFDSGTGWPSFTRPLEAEAVETARDTSWGMIRTEVTCARCDAHLGHVFEDGPAPTGLRYCLNSAALKHAPAD